MRPNGGRLALGVVLLAAVLVACGFLGTAAARADVCDAIPSVPMVPNPVKSGCKVAKGVVGKAPDVVTNPGKAATDILTAPIRAAGDEVMQGVTTWVANGASWLIGQVGKLIDETTTPRIGSAWFARQYGAMGALAALFALPLLLVCVLQGVVRRDGGVIARAAFVQLPLAFLLTAMAVTIVGLLLELTDQMSAAVASSVGNDAKQFFKDTGKALATVMQATGGAGAPLFAVFLGALIAAAGAFVVWLELLVRSAAIYVAVLFLPFTFVAMIWPGTARWCRRLVEILLAVVFAKFVIVAIMALAAAGLGHSRGGEAFQGVLAGAALLLLAAFSPFVLLRLIPMAESAVAGAGAGRMALSGSMLSPVATPAGVMRRVMDSNWSSHGGGSLRASPGAAGTGAGGAGAGAAGGAVMAGAAAAGAVGGAARSRGEGIEGYAGLGAGGDGSAARPAQAPDAGRSQGGGGGRVASPPVESGIPASRPDTPRAPEPPAPRPADREGGLGDG